MSADRRRLTLALLLSLLAHTLLLSLTFGGQTLGLPGFTFPWRERRIEAPDLLVVLVPAQVAAAEPAGPSVKEPLPQASIGQSVAAGPRPPPSVSFAPTLRRTAEVIVPKAERTEGARPGAQAEPEPDMATGAVPAKGPLRTEGSGDAAPPPIPVPEVIAVERSDEATFAVPPPTQAATPVIAVAPSASSPETVKPAPPDVGEGARNRAEPEVRERAVEVAKPDPPEPEVEPQRQRQAEQLEAARVEAAQREAAGQEAALVEVLRVEAARLETQRQEAARLAAAQLEAQRQEAQLQETARVEAARLEAQRQEATRLAAARLEAQRQEAQLQETARVEAARLETQRQEAARLAAARLEAQRQAAQLQEAARVEAARLETQRQEAARLAAAQLEAQRQEVARQEAAQLETEHQEAVRQAAAQKEAARILEEKDEDARREARRQAMGRQLNEEAARREAASAAARSPSTLPLSLSTARRGRLWGRADPNVELVQYAEAWARKIQFNTSVDTVREVAKRPHTNAMVTVAIRSDGTVESVTFVVSSGVVEVDEAIRRIVQGSVPYEAFPPGLAREFDVIEVRRTWHFDTAVRLY
ncbi:MAG: TonB C-terminal domain-containing protein [Betaproteobacteria bacterium]|nr:TonB C-terminal domain-containing protein [Betaproteobacteria bacterium]